MLAASSLEITVRMIVSLLVVGALMVTVFRFSRHKMGVNPAKRGMMVCSRQPLTRSASLMVVQAGSRHLLIGVNDNSVTLLAEGDDLVADLGTTSATTPTESRSESRSESGANIIDALREKTVRRVAPSS